MIRARSTPEGDSHDWGFTLIELLISVVILGIIAVPLSNVIISYFRDTTSISARVTESHDEQIVAAFWQQDVASMGVRKAYDPSTKTFPLDQSVYTSGPYPSSCAVPSGTVVAMLAWDTYSGADGTPTLVTSVYVAQGSSAPFSLVRMTCSGGTPGVTATLAHYLTAVPVVVCQTAAKVATACGGTGTGTGVPYFVNLPLSVRAASGNGQPYSVTLTGQRRQT